MAEFDWSKVICEMASRCPLVLDIFLTVVQNNRNLSVGFVPPMALCYGILMNKRNHELSLIQRINTILLTEGKAKTQVKNHQIDMLRNEW